MKNKALVFLFVLINGTVLFNALLHEPFVGYDAESHLAYIDVLSQGRLPAPTESPEFFSPPLSYALPALGRGCGMSLEGAAKFAQLLNVAWSLVLTFYLLKICEQARPGSTVLKVMSLALLGMLPAYYKTFSFVRPEPLLAALGVVLIYKTLVLVQRANANRTEIAAYGVLLGLVILSRQWGFFLIAAALLFWGVIILTDREKRVPLLKTIAVAPLIGLLVGGWFYFHLYRDYGSITAFNRQPTPTFSFANQPREFYLGLGLDKVFADPIRKSFPNQFLPTFYSDLWGDYWAYFSVYGRNRDSGEYVAGFKLEPLVMNRAPPPWLETNRFQIGPYLGRVNLVSLLPTAILFCGLVFGAIHFGRFLRGSSAPDALAFSLLLLVIAVSAAGFFWFQIRFPSLGKGDTAKATYVLQIFPCAAILGADILQRLKFKSRVAFRVVAISLTLVALHNLPAMITHYSDWP